MTQLLSRTRKTKHVSLSETTIELIGDYAERNNMTFSAAIEALALTAVPETFHMGILELIRSGIRHEIAKQFNRFAKLHAFTAMEAGTAKETAAAVMWWTLREQYQDYLDQLKVGQSKSLGDFERFLQLKKDDPDTQIMLGALKSRQDRYRMRAVKALRSPVAELETLLAELEDAVADDGPEDKG